MSSHKPFRLKLYDFKSLGDKPVWFRDLPTAIYTGRSNVEGRIFEGYDLVAKKIGLTIDYGPLLTYCFRRFGYPNDNWDEFKEIASYALATVEPDLYLKIAPSVGNSTGSSLTFMIANDSWNAVEAYNAGPRKAYQARRIAWIDANVGRPAWAQDLVELVRKDLGHHTWEGAFEVCDIYEGDAGVDQAWIKWVNDQCEVYKAVESDPGPVFRGEVVNDWSDEDPLKKYALAVHTALRDLRTPVRVRDSAIDAYGRVERDNRTLDEPAVAGKACGILANVAPDEFMQLQQLVLTMGGGDAKNGLALALQALRGSA